MQMTKLLTPATNAYLLEPAPQHLHSEALEWLSDLEFYKTEIIFLTKLLDIAFLRVTSDENLKLLKALEKKVRSFREQTLDDLHQRVTEHEKHLSELDEDLFKKNKPKVDEEHHNRYKEFVAFAEEIKELKKEIFTLVEVQMKRSKQASMDVANGNSIF